MVTAPPFLRTALLVFFTQLLPLASVVAGWRNQDYLRRDRDGCGFPRGVDADSGVAACGHKRFVALHGDKHEHA